MGGGLGFGQQGGMMGAQQTLGNAQMGQQQGLFGQQQQQQMMNPMMNQQQMMMPAGNFMGMQQQPMQGFMSKPSLQMVCAIYILFRLNPF
jgi:hypothetical protein